MRRLIHTDTNLLARFKKLKGSLEGCQIARSFQEIERYMGTSPQLEVRLNIQWCKEHCPDSINHVPIYEDIAHVISTWLEVYAEDEILYVCQVSGCKLDHTNQEPEELEAINTGLVGSMSSLKPSENDIPRVEPEIVNKTSEHNSDKIISKNLIECKVLNKSTAEDLSLIHI